MTSNSKSDPPVVRPRRQIRLPAHLEDYQVPGSGYVKRALPTACLNEDRIEEASTHVRVWIKIIISKEPVLIHR